MRDLYTVNADRGRGVSKIPKITLTSFVHGPLPCPVGVEVVVLAGTVMVRSDDDGGRGERIWPRKVHSRRSLSGLILSAPFCLICLSHSLAALPSLHFTLIMVNPYPYPPAPRPEIGFLASGLLPKLETSLPSGKE